MCGIVGYLGRRPALPILLEGLRRLEYRGYDSAGVALARDGRLLVRKAAVRVAELTRLTANLAGSTTGIAHTRWATHGPATATNAHPHTDAGRRIAVVHNGIIENATALRTALSASGVRLVSDTDSEVLAHLIAAAAARGGTLTEAVRTALADVEGTYGLLVLDAERPDVLVAARHGSPLVLGLGDHEMYVASDLAALVRHTQQVVYLEDGELATIRADGFETSSGADRQPTVVEEVPGDYELGGFPDYMAKEIAEQPEAAQRVLRGRLDERLGTARLDGLRFTARELRGIRRVKFLGCGSAYYAGQVGAGLVEELARVPADAEPAAEFRYRNPVVDPDCLYVAVSQSGETADTLATVEELQRKGGRVVGAVNVVGSAIARECDSGVFLHAGPEISVASTKAFTNMAVAFALLALTLGRVRDLSLAEGRRIAGALAELPERIGEVLAESDRIASLAGRFADAEHVFFLGRVRGWPVAREGAQKLKEISYVHAEAYQASELKHGPLALVDPAMPSVVLIPDDELAAKNLGTIEQVKARGGPVVAVTTTGLAVPGADDVVRIPSAGPELDPVLLTIPLQLLAYHTARKLGRDIDKPRNLAKSVTVE
ncbi:glutamine--fructose-6-phosphate transaminase (isomerizing) [Amycolatopsis tucumanensis]|uniref:Glutamine--fructose-6-phosphate aminotransferase [isomerizing] n=1 Tax=Amycolatopsis tucumanensis TaxID=401106 RepID=A0ABP7HNF2_9PSEU|nr:glutamine--fructose-6-phosphate transaminase (isomerizing) [Amycolatopsis tucumanensis]MCF6420928.1 glutamine--fructose-6-phosphate transaminase (isomerizing) [Amycolatopsis tucumanensis]